MDSTLLKKIVSEIDFLREGRKENFIDGSDRAPNSKRYLPVVDPATEMLVAQAPDSDATDVDAAVDSARRAFEQGPWRRMRPADREHCLIRLSHLIERDGDQLSTLETLQNGKLQGIARAVDVGFGAEFVRYMAGWATKLSGETLHSSIGMPPGATYTTYTLREPVGVVGAIVPWNFPLAIALWKVAPALAAGCTIVLKPSEETPLTALYLARLALEAGIPPGVFNVVCGGAVTGQALASHPGINKISFTGSTATGKHIGHAAVDNMTRFTPELGGKSPAVVFNDADVQAAAFGVGMGIFFNQGQVCTANSRIYAQRGIYDDLVTALSNNAATMKIGSGFDPTTQIGPVSSKRHFDRVMGFIDDAQRTGAKILAGGARAGEAGCFIQPTVMTGVRHDARVMREEIFGPVVVVTPFDSVEEGVRAANDTPYGLAASIWTRDLSLAHRTVTQLQAGMVWVNTHNMLDANLPLGGLKQSGMGRDMGRAGIESYTEVKSVCIML